MVVRRSPKPLAWVRFLHPLPAKSPHKCAVILYRARVESDPGVISRFLSLPHIATTFILTICEIYSIVLSHKSSL